ncbi:unnamed protein product [Zymoseptoria tritici ST99CH_1A5]|uniref:Uncharacterized protein n=1 Tax=Zymoseptoria tritici ST99CH_1A5 TaxID=1276529 RepID=A0A1Y6LLX6_ZYMTR|nr:unnamed protein product [Zymoseptoria tritici ST99CH_1A5]
MAFTTTPLVTNFGLDYTKCTVAELHGFIANKCGTATITSDEVVSTIEALGDPTLDPQDINFCITVLKNLDKAARFRFLDLHPELRLLVYEELLDFSKESEGPWKSTWPQILATNKQIHNEAGKILYDNLDTTTLIRISEPRFSESVGRSRTRPVRGLHTPVSRRIPTGFAMVGPPVRHEKPFSILRLGISSSISAPHIIGIHQATKLYPVHTVRASRVLMALSNYDAAFRHFYSLPALLHQSGCSILILKISHEKEQEEYGPEGRTVISRVLLRTSTGSVSVIVQGRACEQLYSLSSKIASDSFLAWLDVENEVSKIIDLVEQAEVPCSGLRTLRTCIRALLPKYPVGDHEQAWLGRDIAEAVSKAKGFLATGRWQQIKAKAEEVLASRAGPAE